MNINELRTLNRSVEDKKKNKAEKSAINLKMDKIESQKKAIEKLITKKKSKKRKKHISDQINKMKYAGISAISLISIVIVVCSLSGVFAAAKPKVSINSVVFVDDTGVESQELKKACGEILSTYRDKGSNGIKLYMRGLPPFIVESSVNKISSISQYDDIDIVSIKKDTRIDSYHINCNCGFESQQIVLSITKNPAGAYRLVGIN